MRFSFFTFFLCVAIASILIGVTTFYVNSNKQLRQLNAENRYLAATNERFNQICVDQYNEYRRIQRFLIYSAANAKTHADFVQIISTLDVNKCYAKEWQLLDMEHQTILCFGQQSLEPDYTPTIGYEAKCTCFLVDTETFEIIDSNSEITGVASLRLEIKPNEYTLEANRHDGDTTKYLIEPDGFRIAHRL